MNNVLVIGGSGFVGRHVVARLVNRGLRVTIPTRHRARARHLILLPTVDVVEADVNDDSTLDRLIAAHDAVINLVGVLHGSRGSPYGREFALAHVELPRRIVAGCRRFGIQRLLHMSALGADSNGPSMYQRSKGDGEAIVRTSALDWTIFRPSVIFGPEDRFLNTFAKLARFFVVLPIGGAEARFQPVWIGDVAGAFVNALDRRATYRNTYELAGPKVYTLRELVEFAAAASGHARPVIALPRSIARLQALLLELMPGEPLMSRDNLDSMQVPNIASRQPFTIAPELGITPTPMEAEAPRYLAGQTARSRLSVFRARARR